MKLALTLASTSLASAFVGTGRRGGRAPALHASKQRKKDKVAVSPAVAAEIRRASKQRSDGGYPGNETPMPKEVKDLLTKRRAPRTSQALPFAPCPAALDGALVGDVGFDPLGFSTGFEPFGYTDTLDTLDKYREAEVKHGRLAMLAAAGWPLAELYDAKIAGVLGLAPALNADGTVPSVLNGGMSTVSVAYWLGCLVLAAALDVYGSYFAVKKNGYVAGDLGFDPVGFYPRGVSAKDVQDRERLRLSEIKHGRLAMIAITAFAAQEFVTHLPVVEQTPVFFRPLWDVLNDQVPGYYIPPDEPAVSAAVEAAALVPEVAAPAAMEATAALPEVAAPAAAEAVAAIPEVAAPAATEAAAIVPPTASADSLAVAPVDDAAAGELRAANARIVELEAKLARIDVLIH